MTILFTVVKSRLPTAAELYKHWKNCGLKCSLSMIWKLKTFRDCVEVLAVNFCKWKLQRHRLQCWTINEFGIFLCVWFPDATKVSALSHAREWNGTSVKFSSFSSPITMRFSVLSDRQSDENESSYPFLDGSCNFFFCKFEVYVTSKWQTSPTPDRPFSPIYVAHINRTNIIHAMMNIVRHFEH